MRRRNPRYGAVMPTLRTLALILLLLAAGCSSRLRIDEADRGFPGLTHVLQGAAGSQGRVHLLVAHGMGEHEPGYGDPIIDDLADVIDLDDDGSNEIVTPIERDGVVYGHIRTRGLNDPTRGLRLSVHELTWSPIVQEIKRKYIGYDDLPPHRGRRVMMNGNLKEELINGRFADPIIYLGSFGDAVRYPVESALMRILESGDPERDRICIIGMSLGSAVLFDVLVAITSKGPAVPGGSGDGHAALVAAWSKTPLTMFMLANQLPLLELAKVPPPGGTAPPPPEMIGDHRWPTAIIAISDPNDLLTYPIGKDFARRYATPGGLQVSWFNVAVSIADTALLGVLADPSAAHVDHENSEIVLRYLSQGNPSKVDRPRPAHRP